ncbi:MULTISPECIES: hypothetical protein [Xanthomonas]|uniref:Uncharacterized protein n=2 Tax=Xanthomonas arboricola pv. pruni TaxID=69929 RepID=A0AAQ0W9M3_9XANT|nr:MULTISPECIES: hypothetical protein [Xanthomonas]KCW98292.1 hypothetical protein DK27_10965 [Xanthomonas arboricola pv. pruni]KPN11526.1 hypothetical protein AN652_05270 [Xanthomonas arboricola pv. pruni]MBB5737992.1 hypothetical protein [Xanthomonas sp. CFBP 8152]MDN0267154.1 hypothetical protein [Xanthomonas arboricola pv. pruni]MDN0271152.1 hypothetical protein [Xanthomonas arboricola pv. pruni]
MPVFGTLSASTRRTLGAALLALWCGWIAVAWTTPRAQATDVASAWAQVQASLPAAQQAPMLIGVAGACACTDPAADRAWAVLSSAVRARGGQVRMLDTPALRGSGYAVWLLGADGQPRYAGPADGGAVCGTAGAADWSRWLPDVLARTPGAALVSPCPCAVESLS